MTRPLAKRKLYWHTDILTSIFYILCKKKTDIDLKLKIITLPVMSRLPSPTLIDLKSG